VAVASCSAASETTFEANAIATVAAVACISIYFTIINKHIAHNLSVACYLLGSICSSQLLLLLLHVVAGKSIKLSVS